MRFLRSLMLSAGLGSPAAACELALVLAVDISGSVDPREYRIQMQGLAAALRDDLVAEALVSGQSMVMVLQWTGESRQRITVPWRRMVDFETVNGLADEIAGGTRVWRNFSTAIGEAMLAAVAAFEEVPECRRRVIDISGDGPSNEGIDPLDLRPMLASRGITVNAVAIEESVTGLHRYFEERVIAGPGAFVEVASGFGDYPAVIRRKLMREVVTVYGALDVGGTDAR